MDDVNMFVDRIFNGEEQDTVKVHLISERAEVPKKATPSAAGYDLVAIQDAILMPMTPTLISTGIVLELPDNYEAQIRSRSGLSLKGIVVANGIGTVDADYRGHVKVMLINFNNEPYEIKAGDRIAQMVFNVIPDTTLIEVDEVSSTHRGIGGFGSTGK